MSKHVPLAASGAILIIPVLAIAMGSRPQADEEAINVRIQPVAKVKLGAAQAAAAAGKRSGEELYKSGANFK